MCRVMPFYLCCSFMILAALSCIAIGHCGTLTKPLIWTPPRSYRIHERSAAGRGGVPRERVRARSAMPKRRIYSLLWVKGVQAYLFVSLRKLRLPVVPSYGYQLHQRFEHDRRPRRVPQRSASTVPSAPRPLLQGFVVAPRRWRERKRTLHPRSRHTHSLSKRCWGRWHKRQHP